MCSVLPASAQLKAASITFSCRQYSRLIVRSQRAHSSLFIARCVFGLSCTVEVAKGICFLLVSLDITACEVLCSIWVIASSRAKAKSRLNGKHVCYVCSKLAWIVTYYWSPFPVFFFFSKVNLISGKVYKSEFNIVMLALNKITFLKYWNG